MFFWNSLAFLMIQPMMEILSHYSAIKVNETMPFVATWMDLEIITLSEKIQRNIKYHLVALICRLKKERYR